MLIGIVAMTESGLIGEGEGLPWHIPDDLKFFQSLTLGETLVCGRKTWEGMPKLKGRDFILYTRDKDFNPEDPSVKLVHDSSDIVSLAYSDERYYLIGGAHMFKTFGSLCQYFYVTEIEEDSLEDVSGDVYFPVEVIERKFKLVEENLHEDEKSGARLRFKYYRKKENLHET